MSEEYFLYCGKCESEFSDIPDEDLGSGILCPECKKIFGNLVGVVHRYNSKWENCNKVPSAKDNIGIGI